jgi:hypothetical protein
MIREERKEARKKGRKETRFKNGGSQQPCPQILRAVSS